MGRAAGVPDRKGAPDRNSGQKWGAVIRGILVTPPQNAVRIFTPRRVAPFPPGVPAGELGLNWVELCCVGPVPAPLG